MKDRLLENAITTIREAFEGKTEDQRAELIKEFEEWMIEREEGSHEG